MINTNALVSIKTRFSDYVSHFYTGDEAYDSSLRLKEAHTARVAQEIRGLAETCALSEEQSNLAEVVAILHDIGRFEQFATYRTYRDCVSENHAFLGVRAIRSTGIIDDLDPEEQELIAAVVEHHNWPTLPESGGDRFLLMLKLVRDADKIDILRVVTDHYHHESTNSAIDIDLPDGPGISEAIIQSIMHGKTALVRDMKTLNDFKLLQVSWVFDLNFPRTAQIVRERKYLEKLRAVLPEHDLVFRSFAAAMGHLNRGCSF